MKHCRNHSIGIAFIYLVTMVGLSSCGNMHSEDLAIINIPYPAPLPDSTPINFLPGLVSTDSNNFNSAFSRDGNFFYFTRKINGKLKIHFTSYDGRNWTKPVIAPFSNNKYSDADPAFAPDGKLYFISNRPKNGSDTAADYDIWTSKPMGNL